MLVGATLSHASAQQVTAPSRVTPPTLQPAPGPAPAVELPEAAGLAPPPNAENLSVTVGRVEVSGTFPGFEAATASIVNPLAGKRVTVAQIYEAANDLEHAYAEAGYFLARVAIPPQQLVDRGTLRIAVIDGVIERIDVKDLPERQQGLVAARLQDLVGVHRLKLAQIERRLLLVSDIPGLRVRSTLTAGSAPGSTLVVMQGTQQYVSGQFGVDDRLPAALGTWSLNTSLALNSVLGLGEQAYGSVSSSPDLGPARLRVLGGGVVMPIGNDGLTINPEYTKSMARPTPPAASPATKGDFERIAVRANYPLIRGRTENLAIQYSVEHDDEQLVPSGFPTKLYQDRYFVTRGRANYSFPVFGDTPVQLSATLSHGLGGRNATVALPLSRASARPVFTTALVEASVQQPLPEELRLTVIGRAQASFNQPLMLAEQFSLAGVAGLSAFPDGAFSVDQGVTLRSELSRPVPMTLFAETFILSPYLFGAGGWGELVMPTALEHRDVVAGSAGLGVRLDAMAAGLGAGTLGFEFARKFSRVANIPSGYRANFALSLRF